MNSSLRWATICGMVLHMICPPAAAAPPAWDHVVIVIEENKSFTQVLGNPANAPYINGTLAAGGASLADMYAITHPSQPNYLQFFSGANQGVTSNNDTSSITPFNTANLGAELLAAGKTFTGYSENLPAVGFTGFDADGGLYARRHNPWVQWQSADAPLDNHLPPEVNQPFTAFPTTPAGFANLPTVSIVVPNNANNMHDGTILQGDTWLQNNLGAYAAWAGNNNSLLIVTFDEDNSASRNRIPTVFYGANVQAGAAVNGTWTLHNLLHTVEQAHGAAHAAASNNMRSIVGAFTTDPAAVTTTFRQGVNAYAGTTDTYIELASPDSAHGVAPNTTLVADGSPLSQGLIRFDDLFGAGSGQVPLGATILSAKLSMLTGSTAGDETLNTMSLHRLNVPFSNDSTWNSLDSGVSLGSEAIATPDFSLLPNIRSDYAIFDVSDSIAAFREAAALEQNINYGWLINPSGTDGWRFRSSEFGTLGDRPLLSVTYTVPDLLGDFDDNGLVNAADIDILWQIVRGAGADPNNNDSGDLNGDTLINENDADTMLASLLTAGPDRAYGDANLSGGVPEIADYNAWRTGASGWAQGDFDGSGGVPELNDYNLWRTGPTAFPTTVGSHGGGGAPLVPEPSTFALAAVGALALLAFRPRRRSVQLRVDPAGQSY